VKALPMALEVSDTIVVMAPALITRGGVGWRLADPFPERHGFTVMVDSGRPLSRGHILLRSDNPTVHPRIFPEYFSEPWPQRGLGAPPSPDLSPSQLLPAHGSLALQRALRTALADPSNTAD
jgi:choline dehydrogenase-like flavoprotein